MISVKIDEKVELWNLEDIRDILAAALLTDKKSQTRYKQIKRKRNRGWECPLGDPESEDSDSSESEDSDGPMRNFPCGLCHKHCEQIRNAFEKKGKKKRKMKKESDCQESESM